MLLAAACLAWAVVTVLGFALMRGASRASRAEERNRNTERLGLECGEDEPMADGYSAQYAEWCRVEMKVKK